MLVLITITALGVKELRTQYQFNKFVHNFIPQALSRNILQPGDVISDPKIKDDSETLIHLPYPYLIAGSFHPELYPHDASYSISAMLRAVHKKRLDPKYIGLAKSMLNDFQYMVNKYGYVLNGNRTYYITRSQTNTIPTNVLEYYYASHDIDWLATNGLPLAVSIYKYWTQDSAKVPSDEFYGFHLIVHGQGPCVEVVSSYKEHNFYYDKVIEFLKSQYELPDRERLIYARGFDYSKVLDNCTVPNSNCKLSSYYYKNDRASRTSGYDTNHLYGPFNSYTLEFISVDHMAKLYRSAKDISTIYSILQKNDPGNTPVYVHLKQKYDSEALKLKNTIFDLLWDKKSGMFYDYQYTTDKLRTVYPFASSLYLIWARIFDINNEDDVARLIKLVEFAINNFEGTNGIYASTLDTGMHWDKPYVWPIHQAMTVDGLNYYADLFKQRNRKGDQSRYKLLKNFSKRISHKYVQANYHDWLSSNGKSIKEKFKSGKEELLTGYASGDNYSWNLLAILDLI